MPRFRSDYNCLLVLCVLLIGKLAIAQSDPALGVMPFSSHSGGQYDSVDPATGDVLLSIPIITKVGKHAFDFKLVGNFYKYALTYGGQTYWIGPNPAANFKTVTGVASGLASVLAYATTYSTCGSNVEYIYQNFVLTDETGAAHPFTGAVFESGPCGYSHGSALVSDGTGYTLTANTNSSPMFVVHDRSGDTLPLGSGNSAVPGNGLPGGTLTDPDGVTMGVVNSGTTYTYGDTLGQTAMTAVVAYNRGGSNPTSAPDTYTYTDINGHAQTVQVNFTPYPWRTAFGCSGIQDATGATVYFPTSIVLADGETFGLSYEPTPGYTGDVTGRLAQLTLPTGGSITYAYSGGNNNSGIQCTKNAWGNMATLKRTENDGNGHINTWTYVSSASDSDYNFTTTETDPLGDTSTYHFHQALVTEVAITDVNLGTLSTTVNCYNGSNSSQTACVAPQVAGTLYPITQTDVYTSLGATSPSLVETQYNIYGEPTAVKKWSFGATYPPSGTAVVTTAATYANVGGVSCGAVGSNIYDRPCTVTTTDSGGNTAKQTKYTYNAAGHAIQTSQWVSGTTYLTSSATYNTNGTMASSTDVNSATTNYYYNGAGGCNNLLLTSTVLPVHNLTTSQTWNCVGGVLTSTADANGQPTTYGYVDQNGTADPLWRKRSTTDPLGNTEWNTFSPTATPPTAESSMVFNGGVSAVDKLTTYDGLGRIILLQTRQAPGSSSFDTLSTGYDGNGRVAVRGKPCSSTASVACSSPTTTTSYDALNRSLTVTDPGGGYTTRSYSGADILVTLGPAPSGENLKKKQMEYDALGRLTSVCEITNGSGSGACGQSGPVGYWTEYGYDVLGNLVSVIQNAQGSPSQARNFTYDGLSRITSESNPEWGNQTTTYSYDAVNVGACVVSNPGDMILKTDAAGVSSCSTYDPLHRVLSIGHNPAQAANTPDRFFVYDQATVNGVAMGNSAGHLAEAYTCLSPCTKVTDLGFTYSTRGELSDEYESTPHSGGYYHIPVTYWANGEIKSFGGLANLPQISFSVDGEGRRNGANNYFANTVFNASGQVTSMSVGQGSGPATPSWTYDPDTGRMTQFNAGLTNATYSAGLNWNPNGSLGQQAISDSANPADTQTCTYAHDDLSRITSANCGSIWSQTYSYDPFGNISTSGTYSWLPGYNGNTNRYTLAGTNYDADGNLLNDTFHTYTWDADGNVLTIYQNPYTYGFVRDALGRIVEYQTNGAATSESALLGPFKVVMNGQALGSGTELPLLNGIAATFLSNGALSTFHMPDWLGSRRLYISYTGGDYSQSLAYSPFGEPYAKSSGYGTVFTGQDAIVCNGCTDSRIEYGFLARVEHPIQGRWITPDPAGLRAANPGNPQSWNRYAYVMNGPLAATDPLGLSPPSWIPGCAWGTVCAGYTMDGQEVTTEEALAALGSGAAVECPQCKPGQWVGGDNKIYGWIPPYNLYFDQTFTLEHVMGHYGMVGTLDTGGLPDDTLGRWGQEIFRGNHQIWANAADSMNMLTAAYGAGFALLGGGAVLSSLDYMQVAVGIADGNLHVAFGVNGTWMHGISDTVGGVFMSTHGAAAFAEGAFQFSLPVLDATGVLPEAGAAASDCLTAACNAFVSGWSF